MVNNFLALNTPQLLVENDSEKTSKRPHAPTKTPGSRIQKPTNSKERPRGLRVVAFPDDHDLPRHFIAPRQFKDAVGHNVVPRFNGPRAEPFRYDEVNII
jgi:hypothetical protein